MNGDVNRQTTAKLGNLLIRINMMTIPGFE